MSPRSDLIEAFLEMMSAERGAGVNTLAAYARDLADFAAYPKGGIAAASREDIRGYLAGLSAAGLAPSSQARRAVDREPAEDPSEDPDQQDGDDEGGQRHAERCRDQDRAIDGTTPRRGEDAGPEPEHHDQNERVEDQQRRDSDARSDEFGDGGLVDERGAEVTGQHSPDPEQVLDPDRLIEVMLRPDEVDVWRA